MAEYQNIKFGIQDRVAVIAIDHPPVNALDLRTLAEIETAFDEATENADVKAIVITGTGQFAFVAGADLKEIQAFGGDQDAVQNFMEKGQTLFNKIDRSRKPVIAAINAVALGGGLELALACQMRIASDRARFGQPEINLGIIPGWGGTQRLQRVVGRAKATEMILTGDAINAQEAYRTGLVNKVVPATAVVKEAMGLAKKIAAMGGLAIEAALNAIGEGSELPLNDGLAVELENVSSLAATNDATEGILAFVEKRRPQFTDS
ncbi:MAG: enoyl-CoA hydratase-related protein [Chloroflexota bacterium]|nr:enoyl-CoA hydratase-related protein [Chloroflexota bacterium]